MSKMAKVVTKYQKALCICGYHVHKDIWEAAVGETVMSMLEPSNFYDRNAVAVEKDGRIIDHLPQKASRVRCTVTGRQ